MHGRTAPWASCRDACHCGPGPFGRLQVPASEPQPACSEPRRGARTLRKARPGFPSQRTAGRPAAVRLAVTAAERGCGDLVSHSCYERLRCTCSSSTHFSVCMYVVCVATPRTYTEGKSGNTNQGPFTKMALRSTCFLLWAAQTLPFKPNACPLPAESTKSLFPERHCQQVT